MKKINTIIGNQIRMYRKMQKKSIVELSNDIGISRSSLSRIENGQQSIEIETLIQISGKLNIPVEDLINSIPIQKITTDNSNLSTYNVYYLSKHKTIESSILVSKKGIAWFYQGIDNFSKHSHATHIYKGEYYEHDNVVYAHLSNVIATHDVMNITIYKSLNLKEKKLGFIMGYREEMDEKPVVYKALFSKENLSESLLLEQLYLGQKKALKYIREYSMFIL